MSSVQRGIRAAAIGVATNLVLAAVEIVVGIVGRSYAVVADGIEGLTDVLSSLLVWSGLRIAARPPDRRHPYGHGKAESIAAVAVAVMLLGAAAAIAYRSVRAMNEPRSSPEWYTLIVLVLAIAVKETLYRYAARISRELGSRALAGDAWHHRSDAITSLAVLVGVGIAVGGGEGYENADDWAALLACSVIVFNGLRLLRPALDEVMDAAVTGEVEAAVRAESEAVDGVIDVEKCRIRKSGIGLLVDLHVTVDGETTVRHGHEIAHAVKDRLSGSDLPVHDVIVHVEPHGMGE